MRVRIDCWCITCDDVIVDALDTNDPAGMAWAWRLFIVCPDCGNKRCPRATHHDHACTGSNEPGQVGSVYGVPHEDWCHVYMDCCGCVCADVHGMPRASRRTP